MRPTYQDRLDTLGMRGAVGLITATASSLAIVAAIPERLIDPSAASRASKRAGEEHPRA
jgi:hypothetical protein